MADTDDTSEPRRSSAPIARRFGRAAQSGGAARRLRLLIDSSLTFPRKAMPSLNRGRPATTVSCASNLLPMQGAIVVDSHNDQ